MLMNGAIGIAGIAMGIAALPLFALAKSADDTTPPEDPTCVEETRVNYFLEYFTHNTKIHPFLYF